MPATIDGQLTLPPSQVFDGAAKAMQDLVAAAQAAHTVLGGLRQGANRDPEWLATLRLQLVQIEEAVETVREKIA